MKKTKEITLILGFKEKFGETKKREPGQKGLLERFPIAFWIPRIRKIGEVSKIEGVFPLAKPLTLKDVRSLLSNEKAKLLWLIKTKKPNSIYELAKISGRSFKAVKQDLAILEKFGLIKFIRAREKNREKLKPELQFEKLVLNINF